MVLIKEGMHLTLFKNKNNFNDILYVESKYSDTLILTLFLNFELSYVYRYK